MANKNNSIMPDTFVDFTRKGTTTVEKINDAAAHRKLVEDHLVQMQTYNPYTNTAWKELERAFVKQLELDKKKEEKRKEEEMKKRKAAEEWIWVSGYKATNRDMKCRGTKFELGKKFDMPEDKDIVECKSGFHLCMKLEDVFDYYKIGNGNRFFEVSALVRKSDVEKYGTEQPNEWFSFMTSKKNKLVSKSILFTRELTADEILAHADTKDWTDDEKKLAIAEGIDAVKNKRRVIELVALGYSDGFAEYVVAENDEDTYKTAKRVATQPHLSMDMKALLILRA